MNSGNHLAQLEIDIHSHIGLFMNMSFDAVVKWVERRQGPDSILATTSSGGIGTQSRPLCPYRTFAVYIGSGSTDDAANFVARATTANTPDAPSA